MKPPWKTMEPTKNHEKPTQLTYFDPKTWLLPTGGSNWPPLIQKRYHYQQGDPTDHLWSKNVTVTNTGPNRPFRCLDMMDILHMLWLINWPFLNYSWYWRSIFKPRLIGIYLTRSELEHRIREQRRGFPKSWWNMLQSRCPLRHILGGQDLTYLQKHKDQKYTSPEIGPSRCARNTL